MLFTGNVRTSYIKDKLKNDKPGHMLSRMHVGTINYAAGSVQIVLFCLVMAAQPDALCTLLATCKTWANWIALSVLKLSS